MKLDTPEIVSKSERETLIMLKYCFMRDIRLSGTAF